MDTELAHWLTGPQARSALAAAGASPVLDPVAAATQLAKSHPHLSGAQRAAVLQQAELRRVSSLDLMLTRAGLEQATDPLVADRRAQILVSSGVSAVVDLTAGLGMDARAMVGHGLNVTCVELDPVTAVLLEHNVPQATVIVADATDDGRIHELLKTAACAHKLALFVDPARRPPGAQRTADGTRAQSERDPMRWSPPLSWVLHLSRQHRGVIAAKVAPGLDPALVPDDWSMEWVSVDHTVREATLWHGVPGPPRRAAIYRGGRWLEFAGAPGSAASGQLEAFIAEPDPALISANLLGHVCDRLPGVHTISDQSHWLTGPSPITDPQVRQVLRQYRVIDHLPSDARKLRMALSARNVGEVTVKSRGAGVNANALAQAVRGPGSLPATVVMVKTSRKLLSLLVEPLSEPSSGSN